MLWNNDQQQFESLVAHAGRCGIQPGTIAIAHCTELGGPRNLGGDRVPLCPCVHINVGVTTHARRAIPPSEQAGSLDEANSVITRLDEIGQIRGYICMHAPKALLVSGASVAASLAKRPANAACGVRDDSGEQSQSRTQSG